MEPVSLNVVLPEINYQQLYQLPSEDLLYGIIKIEVQLYCIVTVSNVFIVGDSNIKDIAVGEEAISHLNRHKYKITYPIDNGIINNMDDMKLVWDLAFDKLNFQPAGQKIVLTEATGNPDSNREKMAEVMFENYKFQGINVSPQAILSLYANGLTTGIVIDSGLSYCSRTVYNCTV